MADLAQKQLEDSLRINEEKMKKMNDLFNTYANIENNFLQQYQNSTDKNIVQTYKDILSNKNALASNIAQMQQ
jgi:hypothetical protein